MDLYAKATSSLNELFAKQLTDAVAWRVVPGQANRVVASPAGQMWVLNQTGNLYVCKEPCTGNWKYIETPNGGARILDLAADAQFVYVLQDGIGISKFDVTGAPGQSGKWSAPVKVPDGVTTIAATANELWADTGDGSFRCAAPCNMASWIPAGTDAVTLMGTGTTMAGAAALQTSLTTRDGSKILGGIFAPSSSGVKLTSASAKTAYGVSSDGKAMKQVSGEWKPIEGLAGKTVTTVSGEMDNAAIQAIETSGAVLRCGAPCASASDISTVDTDGRSPDKEAPKQLAVNASSRNVWQLTPTANSGVGGSGIMARPDSGPINLAELVAPLDAQRDDVIEKAMLRARTLEDADIVAQRMTGTTNELKKLKTRISPEEDPRILKRKIDGVTLETSLRVLQIACATVLVVLLVEMALPAPFSHALAFVVACVGVAVVSFSTAK